MKSNLINVGYQNFVNVNRIVAVIGPESAPIKRLVINHRDTLDLIDATCGRKTRAVIMLDNKQIVLSALQSDTISARIDELLSNSERI